MAIPDSLMKVAAIFFDVVFVLIVTYVIFVVGIRLYWAFKSKRMKGQEIPDIPEFHRLKKGKGVIYVHSPNCKPCKFVDPIVKKLSKELKGVHFVKVNAMEKPEVVRKLGVLATPSLIITESGKVKEVLIGPVNEGTLREKLK